jgi:hypothetical protein
VSLQTYNKPCPFSYIEAKYILFFVDTRFSARF